MYLVLLGEGLVLSSIDCDNFHNTFQDRRGFVVLWRERFTMTAPTCISVLYVYTLYRYVFGSNCSRTMGQKIQRLQRRYV